MIFDQEKLSGFLDGELSKDETSAVEAALEADPNLQADLALLMEADTHAKQEFEAMLSQPIPLALADAIKKAPVDFQADVKQGSNMIGWITALAASLALVVGGAGGYVIGTNTIQPPAQVAAAPGWLADIADYHRIYSAQSRHLVEVPAEEADHIEKWLSKSVGTDVRIPDLSEHGLKFAGARLLVAAAKPVAQLMFTDANGKIVALCLISNDKPASEFTSKTIGGFDMVSWNKDKAGVVIVGDTGRADLKEIANTAAQGI